MTYSNFNYALEGSSVSQLESVMTEKEKILKEEVCTHVVIFVCVAMLFLEQLFGAMYDRV